jgi:hypothetical protein
MTDTNFVLLHRKIIDSAVFANPNHLKIWLWILLKTTRKPKSFPVKIGGGIHTVQLKRGQFLFGRNKAEEELCLSGSLIYRSIQKFAEWGMIIIEANSHYSVITVCKFNSYQKVNTGERTANELPPNHQRTTDELPMDTIEQDSIDNKESGKQKKKSTLSLVDIPSAERNDKIRQLLSTTSIPEASKELYISKIESNSYLKKQGGEFVPITTDSVRADAEYNYKIGWLNTEEAKTNQHATIGGYWK